MQFRGVVVQPAAPGRWSGRRDATSAQNAGPCPKTRRWASSWITTVSRASGGARTRRHENDSRPCREALPQPSAWVAQRDRGGLTPRAGACRAIAASIAAARLRRNHASSTAASVRRSPATRWTTSSSSNLATSERRRPRTAGTTRMADVGRPRTGRRRRRERRRAPRAGATSAACRARCRRIHGSRSTRKATARCSPAARRGPGGRDGHDHAALRVDDDAQAARPRRAAQRVRRPAHPAAADRDLALLDLPHSRPQPCRSRRPARSPVSTPSRTARRR